MPKKKQKIKGSITNNPSMPSTPINEYELITLEEDHGLQIKHEQLIQRVWNTKRLVEDVEIIIKEEQENENFASEWRRYLDCDKIPNPFEPQKIRNFFDKLTHFENQDVENTVNWLLAVDERSILNQDIDSVDMTKRNLNKKRADFAEQYDDCVCATMELSRRIESFLEYPGNRVSKRILHDIEQLMLYAHKKINDYIDTLTYRILYSESAFMKSLDVNTAEYSFQAKHFDIHIWTFLNVPLSLDPEDTPTKGIELTQIKADLVMPFSVLSKNMSIRGLHCNFDHLSCHARYYEMSVSDEDNRCLMKVLKKEWEKQKEIKIEVKESMIKQRVDFEEAMRLKAEEEELRAKDESKKDETTKKATPKKNKAPNISKKLPKEPPLVNKDQFPVITKDFLVYDSLEYENGIQKFHPETLELANGEINLRKFQILGGIYQLDSLIKPIETDFPKLTMTWYKPAQSVKLAHFHTNSDISQSDDISKFFKITFELPEYFCWWGEPVPCIFEEFQSKVEELDIMSASEEKYEENITKPASKTVAYKKDEGKASLTDDAGSNRIYTDFIGSRKSIDKVTTDQPFKNEQSSHISKRLKNKTQHEFKKDEEADILVKEQHQKLSSKWSTTNILKTEYNASERNVTIWTDRLGSFGLAFNRYQHFPFKSWSLQPCEKRPQDLELEIKSELALFKINVTNEGYRAIVTDFSNDVKSQKVFLEVKEPVKEIRALKEKFQQKCLNIFPEPDAVWYVKGIFSEKHLAAEMHTYACISLNLPFLKFHSSDWNKISNRRTIVLKMASLQEAQDFLLIKIAPENVTFVDINEINTESGTVDLKYTPTWRNLEWYPDLNHLITSNYGDSFSTKDKTLIFYLRHLLEAIRPLSFS